MPTEANSSSQSAPDHHPCCPVVVAVTGSLGERGLGGRDNSHPVTLKALREDLWPGHVQTAEKHSESSGEAAIAHYTLLPQASHSMIPDNTRVKGANGMFLHPPHFGSGTDAEPEAGRNKEGQRDQIG